MINQIATVLFDLAGTIANTHDRSRRCDSPYERLAAYQRKPRCMPAIIPMMSLPHARAAGMAAVAVGWCLPPCAELIATVPDAPLIDHPLDLLPLLGGADCTI